MVNVARTTWALKSSSTKSALCAQSNNIINSGIIFDDMDILNVLGLSSDDMDLIRYVSRTLYISDIINVFGLSSDDTDVMNVLGLSSDEFETFIDFADIFCLFQVSL